MARLEFCVREMLNLVGTICLLLMAAPAGAQDLREQVSRDRLEADLRALTGFAEVDGVGFLSRHVRHPDIRRGQAWGGAALAARGGAESKAKRAR